VKSLLESIKLKPGKRLSYFPDVATTTLGGAIKNEGIRDYAKDHSYQF
jgi:hypothetical protein